MYERSFEGARQFAQDHHTNTYDGLPYWDGHLQHVVARLVEFGYSDYTWMARGALHDVIEDCSVTRQEVANIFGEDVAHGVWVVSGIGESRRIRNADWLAKLDANPEIWPLKAVDRLTNIHFSDARFFPMYAKEHTEFERRGRPHIPEVIWDAIEREIEIKRASL